jgi:hypothetical protein
MILSESDRNPLIKNNISMKSCYVLLLYVSNPDSPYISRHNFTTLKIQRRADFLH